MKFTSIVLPAAMVAAVAAMPTLPGLPGLPGLPHPPPPPPPPPPTPTKKSHPNKYYPPITTPTATSSASIFTPIPIHAGCVSHKQAAVIVSTFQWLLANPTSPAFANTANALFSDTFEDISDSINFIAGNPLGSVTFQGKQAFIQGSGSQPPLFVTTLGYFSGCNEIAWRWQSTSGVGSDQYAVKGIDVFQLTPSGQINTVYAEFNSGAFLADLGNPQCSAS